MTIRSFARHGAGLVLDVLFPPTCWAGCRGQVAHGLSTGAQEEIGALAALPFCMFCGLTIGPHEVHDLRNPCGRCWERSAGADRMARVGPFSEPLVTLVHRLKFSRAWEVAGVLAPWLAVSTRRISENCGVAVEALVPVPLHWTRRARRGFNQAELLARETGALCRWQVVNALVRVKRTAEQARTASPAQRARNLRGAFVAPRRLAKHLAGKHVWLVDDVSTTGSTLLAAANALRRLPAALRPASISATVVCVTEPARSAQRRL